VPFESRSPDAATKWGTEREKLAKGKERRRVRDLKDKWAGGLNDPTGATSNYELTHDHRPPHGARCFASLSTVSNCSLGIPAWVNICCRLLSQFPYIPGEMARPRRIIARVKHKELDVSLFARLGKCRAQISPISSFSRRSIVNAACKRFSSIFAWTHKPETIWSQS